jgi:hypothetical protein
VPLTGGGNSPFEEDLTQPENVRAKIRTPKAKEYLFNNYLSFLPLQMMLNGNWVGVYKKRLLTGIIVHIFILQLAM